MVVVERLAGDDFADASRLQAARVRDLRFVDPRFGLMSTVDFTIVSEDIFPTEEIRLDRQD